MFRFKVLLSCLVVFSVSVETLAFDNPGSRPSYLVDSMDEGELKDKLQSCAGAPFLKNDFSIAHRGAPLRFPEHTKESYLAAADMGAGIMECDVTFTKDRELVCRHSQCDLHTTTNILAVPELAAKCSQGFSPAILDKATGKVIKPASAKCCTSDITVDASIEIYSLLGARIMTIENPVRGNNRIEIDESVFRSSGFIIVEVQNQSSTQTHLVSVVK